MTRKLADRCRPHGFSERPLRPFSNAIFRGKHKCHSLNQIAVIAATGFDFLGGVIGLKAFGFLGAVLGLIVECVAGGSFVTK